MKIVVNSLDDMEKLAIDFASRLNLGDFVRLNGGLGAGKTTFTQFVLKHLGVTEVVSSPTFAILKTYKGKFTFHHFDMYRITTEEALEAGFDEILNDKNSIKFVEWGENVEPILPSVYKEINIKFIDDTTREIEINE